MTFITKTDVKAFLSITSDSSDTLLDRLVKSACQQLDTLCNRTFTTGDITEKIRGDGTNRFYPSNLPFEFKENNSITIGDATPLAPSDVLAFEDEGYIELKHKDLTEGELIQITYSSGFAEIPDDVKQAAIEMVVLMLNRNKSIGYKSESDGPVAVVYDTDGLDQIPSVKLVVEAYRIPNFA